MSGGQENWRRIPGHPDYSVSDSGRVMSHKKGGLRLLSMPANYDGYKQVRLFTNGAAATHNVHVLVLLAFVGPRPEGMVCRHLNDVKGDNQLSNLAYGTLIDNAQDAILNRRNAGTRKTECVNGHAFTPENTYLRPRGSGRDCRACHRDRNAARRVQQERTAA